MSKNGLHYTIAMMDEDLREFADTVLDDLFWEADSEELLSENEDTLRLGKVLKLIGEAMEAGVLSNPSALNFDGRIRMRWPFVEYKMERTARFWKKEILKQQKEEAANAQQGETAGGRVRISASEQSGHIEVEGSSESSGDDPKRDDEEGSK